MNISPDGVSVRFKTEPKELFEAEKSGAKSNTVKILEATEADQIKRDPPKKILLQHQQEIFLRTLTHICLAGEALGKAIVIFSWATEEDTETLRINDPTPVLLPRSLIRDLGIHRRKFSHAEFIRVLLGAYLDKHPQEPSIDKTFAAITVSKGTLALLQSIAHGRTMNMVINELYEAYMYQRADHGSGITVPPIPIAKTERCPACEGDLLKSRAGEFGKCAICQALFRLDREEETSEDESAVCTHSTPVEPGDHNADPERLTHLFFKLSPVLLPRTLIGDLNWHRGKDPLPEFIAKLLNDRTGGDRR